MKRIIIEKAYEFLEDVTPKKFDCGKICNQKCCKGRDNDGMLLFPGEKELFEDNKSYVIYFDNTYEEYAVRCFGKCNRNERPLACRIFPYMFYSKNSDSITVAPDIRAVGFCPLIDLKSDFDREFLRALRITARLLSQDKDIVNFIKKISEMITDFNSL